MCADEFFLSVVVNMSLDDNRHLLCRERLSGHAHIQKEKRRSATAVRKSAIIRTHQHRNVVALAEAAAAAAGIDCLLIV